MKPTASERIITMVWAFPVNDSRRDDVRELHADVVALEAEVERLRLAEKAEQQLAAAAIARVADAEAVRDRLRTVLAAVVKAQDADPMSDDAVFETLEMARGVLQDIPALRARAGEPTP